MSNCVEFLLLINLIKNRKRYRAKAQKIELNSLSLFQGLPNIKSPSFDPLIALKSNTLSTNFVIFKIVIQYS